MKLFLCLTLCTSAAFAQTAAPNTKFQEALARIRAQRAGAPTSQQLAVSSDGAHTASSASLSLDAHESGGGKKIDHNWETDYGSYDRNLKRTKILAVKVNNLSRDPAPNAQVDVYWVAWSHDKVVYVAKHETGPMAIKGSYFCDYNATSPVIQENVQNYAALGEKVKHGEKLAGWIVTLTYGGSIVRNVQSDSMRAFANAESLAALVAADKQGLNLETAAR